MSRPLPPLYEGSLPLIAQVNRYVLHWRSLGRIYRHDAWVLGKLCRFMQDQGYIELDQRCFEAWCASLQDKTPCVRRGWQLMVRKFCLFRQRSEPGCFVPDSVYFTRPAPYYEPPVIVTPEQVAHLLDVVDREPANPVFPLRKAVVRMSFVLLFTAGLRRRELLRLTLADVDVERGVLAIRDSKFNKSRLLPMSADAMHEVRRYLLQRLAPGTDHAPSSPLIGHHTLSGKFTGYVGEGLYRLLRTALMQANICDAHGRYPSLRDFRHSFAVQALLRWYREGADVQAQLPQLSLYMGHVSIYSTWLYLHWIPDVATAASRLFETRWGKLLPGALP
jgi:integrase